MKRGDKGSKVKELQTLLNKFGYRLSVDGDFGPSTDKAIRHFKDLFDIEENDVGEKTFLKLNEDKSASGPFSFGKAYLPDSFDDYVKGVKWEVWKPKYIVIHHCAEPSLAQRPIGLVYQHLVNIKDYYKSKGWSSGPHLFVDDDQIFTFSPLTSKGIHAVSFNSNSIGIEMLGNFDIEDPKSGRGLEVLKTTAKAVKSLMKQLGLNKDCIRFHRDDPKTSKTCPGKKITKDWFLSLLA